MDDREIRLRILEQMIPQASRTGITNPETITTACSHFENYVIGSQQIGKPEGSQPSIDGSDKRPRKGQARRTSGKSKTPA